MTKQLYYRLIALWVICEAMLGGIIHGFKIPISGLVVGSCAIVCICLIAWYVPQKGAILKATLIVCIFKMMLSPQAGPPAYIAVGFQGLMGELLFWKRRLYPLSCFLLAILGLLESGLQRIVVLTIINGKELWVAINAFLNGLTKQKQTTNYSLWFGGIYAGIHLLTGILVGWWASRLPKKVTEWQTAGKYDLTITAIDDINPTKKKKRKPLKLFLFIIWILLIGLYVQSYFKIGTPLLPSHISLKILLRSLIIVLGWVFIIGPILTELLHRWLRKRQSRSQKDIQQVVELLPSTRQLIVQSWKQSATKRGLSRINNWGKIVLVNALRIDESNALSQQKNNQRIYVLTAPIQTGKTTSILNWSSKRVDVFGILTPVVNGQRVFMDAHSREQFHMEAQSDEAALKVGRFVFSKANFERAEQIIRTSIDLPGWLVIDEIGPLEIRGEGFHHILTEVLKKRTAKLLLVVRDKDNVLESVIEKFRLHNVILINRLEEIEETIEAVPNT